MTSGVYKRTPEHLAKIAANRRGKVHSDETRRKISLSKIGKKRSFTPEWIENLRIASIKAGCKPPSSLGTKWTEERKQKYIAMRQGVPIPSMRGAGNPNWRGGVSTLQKLIRDSKHYKRWRQSIFERDKYTCLFCRQVGGDLHVDHIKPFSILLDEFHIKTFDDALLCSALWDKANARTLCAPCHRTTPTWATNKIKRAYSLSVASTAKSQ